MTIFKTFSGKCVIRKLRKTVSVLESYRTGLKIVNFESCENFESGFLIFQWKLSVLRIVSFGVLENVVVWGGPSSVQKLIPQIKSLFIIIKFQKCQILKLSDSKTNKSQNWKLWQIPIPKRIWLISNWKILILTSLETDGF